MEGDYKGCIQIKKEIKSEPNEVEQQSYYEEPPLSRTSSSKTKPRTSKKIKVENNEKVAEHGYYEKPSLENEKKIKRVIKFNNEAGFYEEEIVEVAAKAPKRKREYKTMKCEHCDYIGRGSALRLHKINKHTPVSEINFHTCDDCGFKAKLRCHLFRHIRQVHTNRVVLQCEHCEYNTIYKQHFTRHVLRKHSEMPLLFQCETCGKRFKENKSLQRHLSGVHGKIGKDYNCQHCDFTCKSGYLYKNHITIFQHYPDADSATKHQSNSSSANGRKKYKCKLCNYSSDFSSNLDKHNLNIHVTADDLDLFECLHCGYKAKVKYILQRHIIKTHMKNK